MFTIATYFKDEVHTLATQNVSTTPYKRSIDASMFTIANQFRGEVFTLVS